LPEQKRFMIAGGSAPEVEITTQLSKWSKTLQVCVEGVGH
jgi:hypothetical protein